MQVTVDIKIDKPKEDVWRVISDIDNAENVITGILALEILEKPKSGLVGLKWSETREMFGKESSETMWITEFVENEYYVTNAQSHGSLYITTLALREENTQTILSMSFEGIGETFMMKMLGGIMGFMMKGSMKKMLYKDLVDIKNYVENIS